MLDYAEIPLTKGYVALIDQDDYDKVMEFSHSWQALTLKNGLVYAKTNKRYGPRWQNQKRCTYLHMLIMGRVGFVSDNKKIDHEDGNGLNCRKDNLRLLSHSANLLNRRGLQTNNESGVTGVNWHKPRQKWCAEIWFEGKKYYLGLFHTIEEATAARAKKEEELWRTILSQ